MKMSIVGFNCRWINGLREVALSQPLCAGLDGTEMVAWRQHLKQFVVLVDNVFNDSVCSGLAPPSVDVMQSVHWCSDDVFGKPDHPVNGLLLVSASVSKTGSVSKTRYNQIFPKSTDCILAEGFLLPSQILRNMNLQVTVTCHSLFCGPNHPQWWRWLLCFSLPKSTIISLILETFPSCCPNTMMTGAPPPPNIDSFQSEIRPSTPMSTANLCVDQQS